MRRARFLAVAEEVDPLPKVDVAAAVVAPVKHFRGAPVVPLRCTYLQCGRIATRVPPAYVHPNFGSWTGAAYCDAHAQYHPDSIRDPLFRLDDSQGQSYT